MYKKYETKLETTVWNNKVKGLSIFKICAKQYSINREIHI